MLCELSSANYNCKSGEEGELPPLEIAAGRCGVSLLLSQGGTVVRDGRELLALWTLPDIPNMNVIALLAIVLSTTVSGSGQCDVKCREYYVTDCQVCHNIHIKQCDIVMRTVMSPVKLRKCYPVRRTLSDGLECLNGSRTRCKVRYEL